MNKLMMIVVGLFVALSAWAEDLSDADEFLCSVASIVLCAENGECFDLQPWEADVPQFVVVDMKNKLISTTRASDEHRSSPIATMLRVNGEIVLQGIEAGRAFSFVIDESTGLVTVAIARDGVSVSVFGACTDADVKPAT